MSAVNLVRVGPQDAAALDRIAEGVFDEPVRPDRVAAYLAEPNHLMVLALANGVVVGQCAAVVHRHPDKGPELYIDEVGTADAWLRQGIARRMVTEMLAWGRELGCEIAWLGTEPENLPARELYRRFSPAEEEGFIYYEFDLRQG